MHRFVSFLLLLLLTAVASAADTVPAGVLADWRLQDKLDQGVTHRQALTQIAEEIGPAGATLLAQIKQLESAPPTDPRWAELYRQGCQQRRQVRLQTHLEKFRRFVFTRHYDMGGSHYAYTEGQSDAQAERNFHPGAALCLLEMNGLFGTVRKLVDTPTGVIRDPDVSYDGRRILFAWKKSLNEDDYHLYEIPAPSSDAAAPQPQPRQLTTGLGFADYEAAYLPGGDIVFNSTRCVQTVDCWWTEVSNLYTCDKDGNYLRRLSFDQVHTNYPTVTPDGRIIYTRWDYNDRGQIYPQGLFEMHSDGTGQAAFYGNNSWFPTAILHARGIPGTAKVLCVFSGHHSRQKGWLGILDPSKGREEADGAQLIAPVRDTKAVHVDAYGQKGDQFQYPYPLSETQFLVTFRPEQSDQPFAIYWMDRDGRRELLVADPGISCNQPVPLTTRPVPVVRPSMVDYRKSTGSYYIQDIYAGPGLAGIPRGTIKQLRVVALDFRAAGIGHNNNGGPSGGAMVSTPPSIGHGAWDPKIVLGTATIQDDGSAFFTVPARTPLYFQAINEQGHAVQTMRSWSTLQPGENASCTGCHESRNAAPPVYRSTRALQAGPETLRPFYGPPRGFSFPAEIQPILDRHCISCHNDPAIQRVVRSIKDKRNTSPPPAPTPATPVRAFSLLKTEHPDKDAKRQWSESYLALTGATNTSRAAGRQSDLVNWVNVQSAPPMLPPGQAGAIVSGLLPLLQARHGGVKLSTEELDKIACWIDLLVPYCGDYTQSNTWTPKELDKYQHFLQKRKTMETLERENINRFIADHSKK